MGLCAHKPIAMHKYQVRSVFDTLNLLNIIPPDHSTLTGESNLFALLLHGCQGAYDLLLLSSIERLSWNILVAWEKIQVQFGV